VRSPFVGGFVIEVAPILKIIFEPGDKFSSGMSRGIGVRQRAILQKLAEQPDHYVPLHELADIDGLDDPDERRNEMAKARSAIRGLEKRGLVTTIRDPDPDHRVGTTSVFATLGEDFRPVYYAEANDRAWYGLWACLRDPDDQKPLRYLRTLE